MTIYISIEKTGTIIEQTFLHFLSNSLDKAVLGHQLMFGQVQLGQIQLAQVYFVQARLGQLSSGQVMLFRFVQGSSVEQDVGAIKNTSELSVKYLQNSPSKIAKSYTTTKMCYISETTHFCTAHPLIKWSSNGPFILQKR